MSLSGRAEVRGGRSSAGPAPVHGQGAWPVAVAQFPLPHAPRGASFRPARPGRDLAGARRSHPEGGARPRSLALARAPCSGMAASCPRPGCGPRARSCSRFGPGGVRPLSQAPWRAGGRGRGRNASFARAARRAGSAARPCPHRALGPGREARVSQNVQHIRRVSRRGQSREGISRAARERP